MLEALPTLLTVKEAAECLRVARATAYSWVQQGILPCYRLGPKPMPNQPDRRVVRIKLEDIQAHLKAGREGEWDSNERF